MAENPLTKLARLVGGAAMLPGSLGHQVLGQLLISRSTSTELAGANVVLAAVSRQTNAAVQIAVRSIVPAVLVEALSRKERQRIARLSSELERLLKDIELRSAQVQGKPERRKKAPQEHARPQSLEDALVKASTKLRYRGGQREQREEALQYLLDGYVPARTADVQKRLEAKTADEIPAAKSDTIPKQS